MSRYTSARRAGVFLIIPVGFIAPAGFVLGMLVGSDGGDGSPHTRAQSPTRSYATAGSVPSATKAPRAIGAATVDSLRFAVKGDFGSGSSAQDSVTKRMCELRNSTGFTFVLTTGDNFYDP